MSAMFSRIAASAVALTLMSGAFLSSVAHARPAKATLEASVCPTDALRALEAKCYTADLPEDHDAPRGKRISVPVAVLKGDKKAAPLFFFPGGPGSSALDREERLRVLKDGADGRDLVVFAYRGGRGAAPELDCDPSYRRLSAYYRKFTPIVHGPGSPVERLAQIGAYYEACHQRLKEQGVDIAQYTEYNIAFDIDAIRKALGYKAIHVAGHSAGGGAVLTQARLFPEAVASVIAEAPWPVWTRNRAPIDELAPSRILYTRLLSPYIGQRFGEHTFSAFDLDRAQDVLDAEPVVLTFGSQTIRFDGAALMHRLYVDLPQDLEGLAGLLTSVANGDRSGLEAFIGVPNSVPIEQGDTPWGLYLSIVCGDMGADKLTKTEIIAMVEKEPALLGFEPTLACPWWETSGDVPASQNRPPSLKMPVLVITGERDTCCGRRVADELRLVSPSVQTADLAGRGHSTFGGCRNTLVRQFLDNPAKPLDKSCTQK